MQHDKRRGFHSDTVAMPALNARHRIPLRQVEATLLTKTNALDVDAEALAAELRRHVRGEVRFDDGSRALYATDGSNDRQVPIGVVIPRDIDDIIATVATARRYGAPVLARGGGTSLAGQCCNVAVVLDMSKYLHHILAIDPDKKRARVQPGVVLDDLRNAAEQYHLTFGPDPSTHNHCTLGGMIGNNSCGVHSVMAGKTEDNVEELDILTYDGVRLRVGQTSDAELERIIGAGGRRGEIYARLKALRDKYADLIRQRYPDITRRVRATICHSCCQKTVFMWRAPWSAVRVPVSRSSKPPYVSSRAHRCARCSSSAIPMSTPLATTSWRCWPIGPLVWRAWITFWWTI